MWLTKLFSTVSYFDKPAFCEKHDSVKLKIMSAEEKKRSEEIFCVLSYIRKRVMDPFYYNTQYPSTVLGTWFKQQEKISWESSMSWDQLEAEIDMVQLIHDIATYTLAALTQVCVFCEKSNSSFSTWVSNTKEDTDLWHSLKGDCIDLKKVLACSSQYQKILDEMYSNELITTKDYQFVETTFFVTFMIRYSVFSSESVESIIATNQKIMEHTKKFTLEFPIGEDHLRGFEALSQQLITMKGDEKESFSILMDLVRQVVASLKLKKYKEAEVYGHAIVALVPSWCKGYFYLATAVQHRAERVHFALSLAKIGLQNCSNSQCSTCETFQLHVQKWQKESNPACQVSRADKLATEGHKVIVNDTAKKNLSSEADDVPELTDPSSSDESSSDSESDYDAAQEEIPETSQSLPEIKQIKPAKHNSEEDDFLIENQSPLKKTIYEQNDATKPSKEVGPKPPKNNPRKAEKARQRKESSDVTLSAVEIKEKVERFKILLKEGSAAAADGCGLSAMRNFYDAITELKTNPDVYNLDEYELLCLKYAYGSSCCKSGTYEDLNKAITVFNEILNDHQNVRFLVAHYGLGLAYFKLNRFKEALYHFEMLQTMVIDKGIHYPVYSWPEAVNSIEETKLEKLKELMAGLVVKCRSPPSPAAICRHENCLSRPEIYYSDPDFKGFTTIQCQDRCVLQYHPPCWKTLKDALNRTDKDFLGQQCLTPDCEFVVMQIKCIGKDGNVEKHFEIEDNEKLKKHKKSRLEKRLVMKELKKRRRLESQNALPSESSEVCDNNEDELASESIVSVTEQPVVKEVENNEVVANEASKMVESNLSANAKPFYVKKDKEAVKENIKACYMVKKDMESENEKVSKTKERKKAKKPVALSLEEFRQKIQDFSYYSEYKMRLHRLQQNKGFMEDRQTQWSTICESEKIPHLDPNRPFYIPEDLRDDPLALDAVLQSYSSFGKTDFSKILKERIYVHLEKILSWYGPMRVDDPVLLEEVTNFPVAFQQMISDAGGLKDFLLASMRFAFVGDHICIISDVVKAYSLGSKSYNGEGGYSSGCDRLAEYDELSNGVVDEDDFFGENNKFRSCLNPHATEYNPVSPVLSKSSNASVSSNCSLEGYQNDVVMKDLEQESLVDSTNSSNKLREPLLYNGQSFGDPKNSKGSISDQHLHEASLNVKSQALADGFFFADPHKAFEHLAEDTKKLPNDKKFDLILKVLKFVLNDEYYAKNISLFNQHLKPFMFTHVPKRQNRCLQAGTPDIDMHSKAVMKDDEHLQALIENFHDLEHYRSNVKEEKKIVEQRLEHSLDTIAQLQNALALAEKDREKKLEEVQALLEEEKKESKRKEKRFELNQAKISEQLKCCREEIKNLKDELAKKDTQLKEIEDLKKATEIDLENESKAKSEVEASLHEALQFHEIEVSTLSKKLQNAQLEILTIKKNNVLEKISVSTKNAELRLKEIQDGLPMVGSHPFYLEQLKSLQSQIKEHIVKLGKIHCDFVKAADEQINELKKGKDLSDMQPLVEPILSECPALKAPPNAVTTMAQSFAPGSSISQGHPNLGDCNSLGLMLQSPNSSAVQPPGQNYNSFFKTFPQNQKMTTPQAGNFHSTSVLGNLSGLSGSNVSNINPYPIQNLSMMNSSNLFDPTLYPSTSSVYPQKLASSFSSNVSRAPMPPGLSVAVHPPSQGLPNSLPQASNALRFPQTPQQNTSAIQPMLQTPFSFGFPQLHNRATATQLNAAEKKETLERSAAEIAFLNACKKTAAEVEIKSPVISKSHSEKSVSKENISEVKSDVSNAASLNSIPSPVPKGGEASSTCSSPVPIQLSRDKSNPSVSSLSISLPGSEPPTVNKQACTFVDLEATGVKLKQPVANTKQKKICGSSLSGASSVVSDSDPFNLDNSVPESSALELGYTVKETEKAARAIHVPPSSAVSGFARAVKATPAPAKNVPTTTSYEKLLVKLMAAYPQHSRAELNECVGEFRRNNNNKLSNLKFGNIISGIGEILERRRNNFAQASQKRKPQLQVVSLTKKAPAPPPPPEKSGICPWAKPESQSLLAPWHGDSGDTSCTICLEDMTAKCTVKKLECGHRFHLLCLKEWLDKSSNCPICRVHVLLPEDYPSLT